MTTLKYKSLLFLLFIFTLQLRSQNNFKKDSVNIHKVIIALFDGMRDGDSAKVHTTFHNKVRMYTSYRSKTGEQKLEEGNLSQFLNAIGTSHESVWDERIWNTTIQIDGNLAQVWTDYTFYIGDKFSHCGVDAFQLIKDKSKNWKIINLIDTRRTEACIIEK